MYLTPELYCCYIIWESDWHIIAFPTLMYLAEIGKQTDDPNAAVAGYQLICYLSSSDRHICAHRNSAPQHYFLF